MFRDSHPFGCTPQWQSVFKRVSLLSTRRHMTHVCVCISKYIQVCYVFTYIFPQTSTFSDFKPDLSLLPPSAPGQGGLFLLRGASFGIRPVDISHCTGGPRQPERLGRPGPRRMQILKGDRPPPGTSWRVARLSPQETPRLARRRRRRHGATQE